MHQHNSLSTCDSLGAAWKCAKHNKKYKAKEQNRAFAEAFLQEKLLICCQGDMSSMSK